MDHEAEAKRLLDEFDAKRKNADDAQKKRMEARAAAEQEWTKYTRPMVNKEFNAFKKLLEARGDWEARLLDEDGKPTIEFGPAGSRSHTKQRLQMAFTERDNGPVIYILSKGKDGRDYDQPYPYKSAVDFSRDQVWEHLNRILKHNFG